VGRAKRHGEDQLVLQVGEDKRQTWSDSERVGLGGPGEADALGSLARATLSWPGVMLRPAVTSSSWAAFASASSVASFDRRAVAGMVKFSSI
jgi:hypothetical protein